MEQVIKTKKEKANLPLTLLLFLIAILFIFGPLYMTVVIALKSPQEMGNVLALPKSIQWSNFTKAWEMTDYPRKFRKHIVYYAGKSCIYRIYQCDGFLRDREKP